MNTLRALLEKATPGPWLNGERILPEDNCVAIPNEEHADIYRETPDGISNVACATFNQADAELVCAAVSALPVLLDELTALRTERDRLKNCARRLIAIEKRIIIVADAGMMTDQEEAMFNTEFENAQKALEEVLSETVAPVEPATLTSRFEP